MEIREVLFRAREHSHPTPYITQGDVTDIRSRPEKTVIDDINDGNVNRQAISGCRVVSLIAARPMSALAVVQPAPEELRVHGQVLLRRLNLSRYIHYLDKLTSARKIIWIPLECGRK